MTQHFIARYSLFRLLTIRAGSRLIVSDSRIVRRNTSIIRLRVLIRSVASQGIRRPIIGDADAFNSTNMSTNTQRRDESEISWPDHFSAST